MLREMNRRGLLFKLFFINNNILIKYIMIGFLIGFIFGLDKSGDKRPEIIVFFALLRPYL